MSFQEESVRSSGSTEPANAGPRSERGRDSPRRGYAYFRARALDGGAFSLDDLEEATGWSRGSIDTYRSKQWKELLTRTADGRLQVRREFLRLSESEFLDHISQKRPLFAKYARRAHPHYVMFEFLLPLTRESELRAALDQLFFSDTMQARLEEIGLPILNQLVSPIDDEPADAYLQRVASLAAENFGGYSISHVAGRYKANTLMSRSAAAECVAEGGRYLIDETTASVRFIVPCRAGEYWFADTISGVPNPCETHSEQLNLVDACELKREVGRIRQLFFLLFVETVVRTIKGEDEIWLVESGASSGVFRWERVPS